MITQASRKEIAQRAREAEDAEAHTLERRDFVASTVMIRRQMSDSVGGYRRCHVARCRRARRCAGDVSLCLLKRRWSGLSEPDEHDRIEELYWQVQAERLRLEQAEAAGQKASVNDETIWAAITWDGEEGSDDSATA